MNTTTASFCSRSFLKSLPLTAAALGDKLGVSVMLGQDACTDGASICLPVTGIGIAEDELLGYLTHEAAHIRLTSFDVAGDTPLEQTLINALEDIRVENGIAGIYKGARMLLDACTEKCVESLEKKGLSGLNPGSLLALYCLCKGHSIWTRLDYLRPLLGAAEARMEQVFGPSLRAAVDQNLLKLPGTTSTLEVKEIACRILNLLRQQGFASKPPSDQPNGSEASQAVSARQLGGQSAAASENAAQQSSNCPRRSPSADSLDAQAGESAGGAGFSEGAGTRSGDEAGSSASGDACIEALCSHAGDLENDMDISRRYGLIVSDAKEKEIRAGLCTNPIDVSGLLHSLSPKVQRADALPANDSEAAKRGLRRIAAASSDSAYARRALKRIVTAQSRISRWSARSGLRIAPAAASRLAVWNSRVFERKLEGRTADTALHVLVDMSGSMHARNKEKKAIQASLALFAALKAMPHVNPGLSSFGLLPFVPIVPHGARSLGAYAERIGRMKADGSTPLDAALVGASVALAKTKEAKKAVLVITDGQPDDFGSAVFMVSRLRVAGIRIYGLGIDSELSPLLFDVRSAIQNIDELEPALFEIGRQVALEANGALRR